VRCSTYQWIEHTSELELHIEAETLEQVFAEALEAFAELVARDDGGERAEHEVTVGARDGATLLTEWLTELVYLAETEDFIPERVKRLTLADSSLRAVVVGRRGSPAHLVKGVTYHGLELDSSDGVWRAKVVLDV
jgi:protein archease